MRCCACDKALSDKESTRKGVNTGDYLDMCDHCFSTVADDFPYIEGHGGRKIEEVSSDDFTDEESYNGTWEDR